MSTENPDQIRERRSSGGVGTGAFSKMMDHLKDDRERDSQQQAKMIEAMQGTIKMLGWVITGLVLVLAILVAGVIGVGVTGKVPGVGEIEVVHPNK